MKQSPKKRANKSLQNLSVTKGLLLTATIGAVALVLGVLLVWFTQVEPLLSQKNIEVAENAAQYAAAQLDHRFVTQRRMIEARLKELSFSQSANLEALLRQELENIPFLEGVWVFREQPSAERATQDPLIGFAALAMVKQAFEQEGDYVEVHRLDDQTTILNQVFRIKTGQQLSLVLIAQNAKAFTSTLPKWGSVVLTQTIAGQQHQFARVGQGTLLGAKGRAVCAQLPWQVEFFYQPKQEMGMAWLQLGFIILVLLLAIFSMAWLLAKHYRKQLTQDIETLHSIMATIVDGQSYSTPWFSMREFNRFDWHYEQFAKSNIDAALDPHRIESPAKEVVLQSGECVMQESFDVEELKLELPDASPTTEQIELEALKSEAVPAEIFRACDIRGQMGNTLSNEVAYLIGLSFASQAKAQKQTTTVVGFDGRHSSPQLSQALIQGLRAAGQNVINIGLVPTPLLYFATYHFNTGTGIMITGSHNPKDYNGFKMMIAGETLAQEKVQQLYERIQNQDFSLGQGEYEDADVITPYIEALTSRVDCSKPLKIVIDCGNGAVGILAERLFAQLGCEVVPLYCDVDGDFPNHHPDPGQPDNLSDLIQCVTAMKADCGIAFDGDGDRLGVITPAGEIIWPDRLMMLFARDCLERHPGANIIFDVKCTKYLAQEITQHGGNPIMYKTGHALIKKKMQETDALLAGEMSGHFFFKEDWYGFDDGCFAAAKLLAYLSQQDQSLHDLCAALPNSVNTPEINVAIAEDKKFGLIEKLQSQHDFKEAEIITVDGLRVEFPDGWGLVRASNTTPCLVLRFEANDEKALNRIKEDFKSSLLQVEPTLDMNF